MGDLCKLFESMTDEEAEKMPYLFQRLRLGYLEWKKTGKLPNGEAWQPEAVK